MKQKKRHFFRKISKIYLNVFLSTYILEEKKHFSIYQQNHALINHNPKFTTVWSLNWWKLKALIYDWMASWGEREREIKKKWCSWPKTAFNHINGIGEVVSSSKYYLNLIPIWILTLIQSPHFKKCIAWKSPFHSFVNNWLEVICCFEFMQS